MDSILTQGQRIRQMRIEHRYTQEYIAKQLGTTKQAIYKYETDLVKSIPPDKLLRLSQLFNCSPSWLQALSNERGTAPIGQMPLRTDIPCGTPHHSKNDMPLYGADTSFTFYRDFMQVMLQLEPYEQQSVMQFARFLASQHPQETPITEETE